MVVFTSKRREVLDVNIGMLGQNLSHVCTIQHYWNHIVGKDFPKLFRNVVLTEGILQREVELEILITSRFETDQISNNFTYFFHLVGCVDHVHA